MDLDPMDLGPDGFGPDGFGLHGFGPDGSGSGGFGSDAIIPRGPQFQGLKSVEPKGPNSGAQIWGPS